MPATLFDKIWDRHEVLKLDDGSSLIYVDRLFLHERTGAVALTSLAKGGRALQNPRHVFATMDHIVDTLPGRGDASTVPGGEEFIRVMRESAADADVRLFDMNDPAHGISHLIAAEQGIALPGLVIACPDSHTCTLGALGAIGWGIGTSDCEHVLATETLKSRKPQQMRVLFAGELAAGVTAKDMILHLIATYGAFGAKGYALEFAGPAVTALPMDARFTLCNMAVEFAAFTGIIAPDEKVLEYVAGKSFAPDPLPAEWTKLVTDDDAHFDKEIVIDAAGIAPTISWGISPQHAIPVTGCIPAIDSNADEQEKEHLDIALNYMALSPGQSLLGLPVDGAFIGSCTNARLSDLREAAKFLKDRKVANGVRAICTPGSAQTKRAAEAEGIDQIFLDAGFEWREPGCSLCFHAGGERFESGQRVVTSTNRNFRGRQGPGVRSHLASPASVAAAAVAGQIVDVREVETSD